ncbi:hypothetical protein HMPREF1008_00088 [Olsenella sp. oral taxon 809 str. F0356]|uniref:STM3941 family protein n=1 Tax=Olsenella sp. oral taxon 809 TaxID=661086 RepID=UPI000231EF69|nr:STM3941 family protein [Olsenella sp. oral taxon 809]EHF03047.1 hypothetical protein HMPREF1008_00088 [Olsenella sp. oral taxon 809 str. F0356]
MPEKMTSASKSKKSLVVKRNAMKYIALVFMGICLFTTALFCIFAPLPYADNELLMRIGMGYLGLPTAIAIIVFNSYEFVVKRKAIILDEHGITDYTNSMSSGFTPWDEISDVYLLKLKSGDYLCADPVNLNAWLGTLSKKQIRLAQANMDLGFSPIRVQFSSVTDAITAKEGVDFVKTLQSKKVSHTRKPRY